MLKPFASNCPGLSGPESRQDIYRQTFGDFFARRRRVVIPIFQRRYCWDATRVNGWLDDAITGKRDHLGLHNSGNVVVKQVEVQGSSATILIDGQQRMTTTLLLCAALRDALLKLSTKTEDDDKRKQQVIDTLESALYTDKSKLPKSGDTLSSSEFRFSRLVPSHSDRAAYFALIVEGLGIKSEFSDEEISRSIQATAKRIFDHRIKVLLSGWSGDPIDLLSEVSNAALFKMSLTMVDILNKISMPQVFLWLQEKGLFGEGSILYNPSPGIDFETSDLVRNLLMSVVADESLEEQEHLYKKLWLDPIESKCKGPNDLSQKIGAFRRSVAKKSSVHYISDLEKMAKEMSKSMSKDKVSNIITYTEFYSLFEQRVLSKMMLPPNLVGKLDVGEADPQSVRSAAVEVMNDLAGWISNPAD